MININELRIGNIICQDYDKHPVIVRGIEEVFTLGGEWVMQIRIHVEWSGGFVRNTADGYSPILITSEILCKCGFVKTDNENEDCYRYGSGGYEIWGNGKENGSDKGVYHINDAFIIYLDFLHQLQNFHFINTGEELKYNP